MGKFNAKSKSVEQRVAEHPSATVNLAGGLAFNPSSAEMALYLRTCASFLEDKYYEKADDGLKAIQKLVREAGQEFTLKLANYARTCMYLRSLPVMLLAEASALQAAHSQPKGLKGAEAHTAHNKRSMVRDYTPKILQRADEPAELLSYWIKTRGSKKGLPDALKKGISDAYLGFQEYNIAKYDRDSRAVKTRDVLGIVHLSASGKKYRKMLLSKAEAKKDGVDPKWDVQPEFADRFDLYRRAFVGELKSPDTWETYISSNGSTKETWEHVVEMWTPTTDLKGVYKVLNYMAMIRNLRNLLDKGVSGKHIDRVVYAITKPEAVLNSKQLPFRFLSAAKAVEGHTNGGAASRLADALRSAIEISVQNIPKWQGKTAVFSDNSGSMHSAVSAKSTVQNIEIAGLMSALSVHLTGDDEYRVGAFGETFAWVPMSKKDSILSNSQKVAKKDVGHSTHAHLAIDALVKGKIEVDRVLVFSDMQCYSAGASWGNQYGSGGSLAASWKKYLSSVNPKAVLYSVDLASYGTTQFQPNDPTVVQLAGFSDQVLRLIPAYDGRASAISEIREKW